MVFSCEIKSHVSSSALPPSLVCSRRSSRMQSLGSCSNALLDKWWTYVSWKKWAMRAFTDLYIDILHTQMSSSLNDTWVVVRVPHITLLCGIISLPAFTPNLLPATPAFLQRGLCTSMYLSCPPSLLLSSIIALLYYLKLWIYLQPLCWKQCSCCCSLFSTPSSPHTATERLENAVINVHFLQFSLQTGLAKTFTTVSSLVHKMHLKIHTVNVAVSRNWCWCGWFEYIFSFSVWQAITSCWTAVSNVWDSSFDTSRLLIEWSVSELLTQPLSLSFLSLFLTSLSRCCC